MNPPNSPGPVVFMPHYHEAIHTFRPVSDRLAAEGIPVLYLLENRDGVSPGVCRELGLPWRRIPAFKWGRHLPGGPPAFFRESHRAWRFVREFMQTVRPSALVMTDDRRFVESLLVAQGRRRKTFSLVVMWAATNPPGTMTQWRERAAYNRSLESVAGQTVDQIRAALVRWIVQWVAPQALRHGPDGRLLLWQPLSAILAMALLGCYPRHPWVLGGGWAEAAAVVGERYRDMIAAEGVPVSKIHVAGHPRHDRTIADGVRWRGPERETIRREIGAPKAGRLVALAAPPVAHILRGTRAGHIAPETMAGYLRYVVGELLALGGDVHLAVKIHPRDADLPLSWLDGHDREFSVVRAEMEAARLIGAADLLVCQGSSVVFDAHLLDVPTVTFDFFRTPGYDMWAKAGGVLHVTDPAAFSETVCRALDDPETRRRLAAGREEFRRTHLRDDGRATERIVELIQRRIGR